MSVPIKIVYVDALLTQDLVCLYPREIDVEVIRRSRETLEAL